MSASFTRDFPSLPELGDWLPQYEVQTQVHTGADGALYLGRQTALDRMVILEVIPDTGDKEVASLLDRLRSRARLVHPGITAVYDFGKIPSGFFYLVTEHVEGRSLRSLIVERQIKPKNAFPLALQICEALQLVHDQELIHGALSPATILIGQDSQAKLTCIGMAETEEGQLSWLHPFLGSYQGDIHDLGITLHWMFARCEPEADGRLSRDLPPHFAAVLRRCLGQDPSREWQRPAEVAEALKDALRREQEWGDSPTRSKMVVAAGAKPTSSPVAASQPVAAPPKIAPGQIQPVVRQSHPSFFQKLDAFVWRAFSTGLHLLISVLSIGSLILLVLFKDRIVFEEDSGPPKMTAAEIAEANAAEEPLPAEVLGALPPMQSLPTTIAPAKPITLPPPSPPKDPLADLRAQYVAAVQQAANQALETVRLDDLPYLQKELQLLQNNGEIPEVDEPNLPATLKALRQRYREARMGIAR